MPVQWKVRQEERKSEGRGSKTCIVSLVTELNKDCKQILSKGERPNVQRRLEQASVEYCEQHIL